MRELRHPAKPILQNVLNLGDTVNINENPEETIITYGKFLGRKLKWQKALV